MPVATSPLSPRESRALDALFDRIFPPGDDGTPGAVEVGAADYLRGALAGPYAAHVAEYRATLAALDAAAGGDYAGAATARQDAILAEFEANTLEYLPANPDRSAFDLVWRHLREGLFCDPAHGGNRDGLGWKLIGFPGAQFGYTAAEQEAGRAVTRAPRPMAALERDARLPEAPATTEATGPVDAVDVVIVGGGAVGGFMAHRLVEAGKSVVILEAGGARTGREHVMDELSATAFRNLGGAEKFNAEVPTSRLRPGQPARRAVMSQGLETALGGNSVAWGAVAMRFYEEDFRVRSATVAKYGEDSLPADSTLADWPMTYADLEPYYDAAEGLLGVSGHAGGAGAIGRRSRGNPFEAPRSRPYAMPALRTSGLGEMFATAARSLGYHPFPLPAAILTAPLDGRHACTYCGFCSRFGCHVDAKASAQNTVLPKALATGRLTILTGARVMEIITEDGAAVGAAFLTRDGVPHVQRGRTIVVATYAFENTRLLLLSRDAAHPAGLGNNRDQVGRNYLTRQQPSVHAVFDAPVNRFIGPTAQAMAIADLSCDHFDHEGLGFVRGGRVAAFNQYLPIEASAALPPDIPRYGKAWRDFFVHAYARTSMLFIDPEILPSENNRLDLDPEVRDAAGRPVIRITFDVGENEKRMIPWIQDRTEGIAKAMGATRIWRRPVLTGPISTHDTGGTRMGDDPAGSVTDGFGRVHDTPNLVVIGGSSFVSLPPVNPALTILALSLRSADAIVADQSVRATAGGGGVTGTPDVIVAGAGIIGAMIAWHLAKAGARVTLVDPAPARAAAPSATWASAGGLRRQGRSAADQPLSLRAGTRWPGMERELGADLEVSLGGHLHIAETEDELPALAARHAADRAAGIDIRWLDGTDLRALAPELTPRAIAGVWTPGDGQAHPGRVARAALDAFRALGGTVRLGAPVALTGDGTGVTGVAVDGGKIAAGLTIVAAGAWSAALVAPLGFALPLRWRGLTMLLSDLAPRDLLAPTVTGVGRNLSLKQLRSGQFMLGGRWYAEPAGSGFAARPVDAHIAAQWSTGVAVLPRLARHKLVQAWAGAEAQSPDGNPLIGRAAIPGLYLACGFSNHGFQISPAVGEAVAEDVTRGSAALLLPFDPRRLDTLDSAALARFTAEPILEVA